jgi:hypothetical protein
MDATSRVGLRGVRAGFREAVADSLDLVTEDPGAKEGAIGPANQVVEQEIKDMHSSIDSAGWIQ